MDQDGVEVAQDFDGRDAKRFEPALFKAMIPARVTLWPTASCMGFAVDLNCKPRLQAGEVDPIAELRVLAAKLEASWGLAQLLPEENFRQLQLCAFLASLFNRAAGRAEDFGHFPSTTRLRRAVPLPVPGRN